MASKSQRPDGHCNRCSLVADGIGHIVDPIEDPKIELSVRLPDPFFDRDPMCRVDPTDELLRTGAAKLTNELKLFQDSASLAGRTADQVITADLARTYNLQIIDEEDGNFRAVNQLVHLAFV